MCIKFKIRMQRYLQQQQQRLSPRDLVGWLGYGV